MAGRITAITTTIIIRPLRLVRHRMVFMAVPLAMRPGMGRMADFPIWALRMVDFTGVVRRAGIFMAGITAMAPAAETFQGFEHPGRA